MLTEKLIELGEHVFHHVGLGQLVAQPEDGGGVRHLRSLTDTEKPGEGVAVENLVLHGLVGEVIESLGNKDLEQQGGIVPFGTGRRLARLFPCPVDEFTELFPVHDLVEFNQQVTGFVDTGEELLIIEESELWHGVISEKVLKTYRNQLTYCYYCSGD